MPRVTPSESIPKDKPATKGALTSKQFECVLELLKRTKETDRKEMI